MHLGIDPVELPAIVVIVGQDDVGGVEATGVGIVDDTALVC